MEKTGQLGLNLGFSREDMIASIRRKMENGSKLTEEEENFLQANSHMTDSGDDQPWGKSRREY